MIKKISILFLVLSLVVVYPTHTNASSPSSGELKWVMGEDGIARYQTVVTARTASIGFRSIGYTSSEDTTDLENLLYAAE
jgi:hypothetical protein